MTSPGVSTSAAPDQKGLPGVAFLLGPARAGTSLVYKMICLHPDVGYISNYLRRTPQVPWLGALNRVPRRWDDLQQQVWFAGGSQAYSYNRKRSWLDRVTPQPVEGEPVFAHAGFRQYPWDPVRPADVRTERLQRTLRHLSRSAGATTVVSKRIANNRRVPELVEACPEARFVAIVRDGRAVAASLATVDWWDDDPLWWDPRGRSPRLLAADGADPWALCARNWVEDVRSVEQGLAGVPHERVLRLRYEDIVVAPRDVMVTLAEFIGVTPHEEWLAKVGRLRLDGRNDGWRTLPRAALQVIEDVQRDELQRYGYQVQEEGTDG